MCQICIKHMLPTANLLIMYKTHASDSKFTNYFQYINIFSHIKHTDSYILHAYYVTLHQNRNTKNQKK